MKKPAQDPTKLIVISRRRAAEAYYNWLNRKGRAARGSEVNSDKLFTKDVYRMLDIAQDGAPSSLGIPTVRSGWWNWLNGRCATDSKRIRLDVCRAFRTVTGVDISGNAELTHEPDNATDLVRLGPVHKKRSGGAADETEIFVDYINFKVSAAKDVTRDLTKIKPKTADYEERIGSVRYVLYEASVFVSGSSNLRPSAKRLSSRDLDDEVELRLDRDDRLRFRAQPKDESKTLKGDIEGVVLARGGLELGEDVTVKVSIARGDINPMIEISHSKMVSADGEQRAREELIEQVLLNRLPDDGPRKRLVVAQAKAVGE